MQKVIREFRAFFVGGNVIDLAVAFIMGGLFAQIIEALAANVIMPIIGIIFGKPNFDQAPILTINDSQIKFGAFLTVLVAVSLMALAVFLFIVKPYNSYRARKVAATTSCSPRSPRSSSSARPQTCSAPAEARAAPAPTRHSCDGCRLERVERHYRQVALW